MQTYFKSSDKSTDLLSSLSKYQSMNLFQEYNSNCALHHKNLQLIAKKLPELKSRLTLIIKQQFQNKSSSFTFQLQKFLEQLNQLHKQINKEIFNHKNLCNSTSFKNKFKELERNVNYDETIELAKMKSENIILKDQIDQKIKQLEKIRKQLMNNYQSSFRIKQKPNQLQDINYYYNKLIQYNLSIQQLQQKIYVTQNKLSLKQVQITSLQEQLNHKNQNYLRRIEHLQKVLQKKDIQDRLQRDNNSAHNLQRFRKFQQQIQSKQIYIRQLECKHLQNIKYIQQLQCKIQQFEELIKQNQQEQANQDFVNSELRRKLQLQEEQKHSLLTQLTNNRQLLHKQININRTMRYFNI